MHFRFRQPCISKATGRIVKPTRIWDSGANTWGMQGTFYIGMFKVIRCISSFQPPCISKTVGGRGKVAKIWASGLVPCE